MLLIKIFLALLVIAGAFFSIIKNMVASVHVTDDMDSYEKRSRENEAEGLKSILKLKPIAIGTICVLFVVASIFGSVFFTNEQEIGFTRMFGQNTMIDGPGMHFKIPFLSEKKIYDATTQGMPIGYYEESDEVMPEDSLIGGELVWARSFPKAK